MEGREKCRENTPVRAVFGEYVQVKDTLMSPSNTNNDDTKLFPWKEGVAKAFVRRESVCKATV